MPISDSQYIEWLSDPSAIRCTLIDINVNSGGSEITRYVSTLPYVMSDGSYAYLPIVTTNIQFTETLDIVSTGSISVGDLELENSNGIRDSWFNDVWINRSIVAYIGDPRWAKTDFRVIFNGIIGAINAKSRDSINLQFLDKLQRLNTPVSSQLVGGDPAIIPNALAIIPTTFGEVFNVTPLLINPATLEYQVHYGPIEEIIEARDNGVPIPVTVTPSTGTFVLEAQLQGTLTCSVQGCKSGGIYKNTVSKLVQELVLNWGQSALRFTTADLDTANLAAFDTANQQAVGMYLTGSTAQAATEEAALAAGGTSVLSACQTLAASIGAQLIMSRAGLLRLLRFTLPVTSTFTITDTDMELNSLQVKDVSEVKGAAYLGYCQNYTVQNLVTTGLPVDAQAIFNTDWRSSNKFDATTIAMYKLEPVPQQVATSLLSQSDADTEAQRRVDLFKVPRITYSFNGFARLLQLELGQGVTIITERFGMTSGKTGMVTSLTPDWDNGKVAVEVTI